MPMNEMSAQPELGVRREAGMSPPGGGYLYMQTNQVRNAIIHRHRSGNGTLTEVERVATDGAASGTFKPISSQESAPNSFESAASVILSSDCRLLFATNGGDMEPRPSVCGRRTVCRWSHRGVAFWMVSGVGTEDLRALAGPIEDRRT